VEGRKKKLHVSCEEIFDEKIKNNTKGIPFATIDQRVIIPPPRFLLVEEKKNSRKRNYVKRRSKNAKIRAIPLSSCPAPEM